MNWDDIGYKELYDLYVSKELSDAEIANMFNLPINKVSCKRKELGITFTKKVVENFESQNSKVLESLNYESRERLLQKDNINGLSVALTHYLFRNGPIEDMHSNGQLSQHDMKTLNKYMVNRICGILHKISENKWLQLELLYSYVGLYGRDWDTPVPDTSEIDFIWNSEIENII